MCPISGQSTVEESLVKCFSQKPGDPDKCFAYGGTHGKILASRTPLSNVDHLIFNTTQIKRSAVYAKVHLPTLGDTHMFVPLHPPPPTTRVPRITYFYVLGVQRVYTFNYHRFYSTLHWNTWEQQGGEQRTGSSDRVGQTLTAWAWLGVSFFLSFFLWQTVAVLDWLQSKVKNPKEPVIIMGDLNSSPSIDNVVPAVSTFMFRVTHISLLMGCAHPKGERHCWGYLSTVDRCRIQQPLCLLFSCSMHLVLHQPPGGPGEKGPPLPMLYTFFYLPDGSYFPPPRPMLQKTSRLWNIRTACWIISWLVASGGRLTLRPWRCLRTALWWSIPRPSRWCPTATIMAYS